MFSFYARYSTVTQHCFICRPSDSTVSEEAGIEPRTVATLALTARRSIHQARSYLHSARSNPHSARSHPQSARSHPHSARSHSFSVRSHPPLARFHSVRANYMLSPLHRSTKGLKNSFKTMCTITFDKVVVVCQKSELYMYHKVGSPTHESLEERYRIFMTR